MYPQIIVQESKRKKTNCGESVPTLTENRKYVIFDTPLVFVKNVQNKNSNKILTLQLLNNNDSYNNKFIEYLAYINDIVKETFPGKKVKKFYDPEQCTFQVLLTDKKVISGNIWGKKRIFKIQLNPLWSVKSCSGVCFKFISCTALHDK